MNYGSNKMKLLLPNAHKGLLLLLVNMNVSSNLNVELFNKRLTGGFLITDGIKWFNNFDLTKNVQCVLRQGSKLSYKAALMFPCLLNYTLMHFIHTER